MKLLLLLLLSFPLLLAASMCGIRGIGGFRRHARAIIGGTPVAAGQWPWQVLVSTFDNGTADGNCGGTIIGEKWILTAAHCIRKDNSTEDLSAHITMGFADFDQIKKSSVSRKSIGSIVHENYTDFGGDGLMKNDIALVKLDVPLEFDNKMSAICLPNLAQSIPSNRTAAILGFGRSISKRGTNETSVDGKLRQTAITILDQETCQKVFYDRFLKASNLSAAEDREFDSEWQRAKLVCGRGLGRGIHKGDSGGPIMMKATDGRWFQLGITSFGDTKRILENDLTLGIYTDVRAYCDWIEENTGGEVKCGNEEVYLQEYDPSESQDTIF